METVRRPQYESGWHILYRGIRSVALAAVLVFVAVVIFTHTRQIGANDSDSQRLTPQPEYGWKLRFQQTKVLDAAASTFGWDTHPGNQVKVHIRSTSPVNIGFAPANWSESFARGTSAVSANLDKFECLQRNVLETEVVCEIPANTYDRMLVIQDARSGGSSFVAGVAAVFGAKEPLNQTLARNDVSMAIYDYGCIRNCH